MKWYTDTYNRASTFAKQFLPAIPKVECPSGMLVGIANKVRERYDNPGKDSKPPLRRQINRFDTSQHEVYSSCRELHNECCLDQEHHWIHGDIQQLLGTHRDNACKFVNEMGVLEGRTFDMTATLEALPSMSTWISDLSDDLQSILSLNKYFPVWPKSQCTK